MANDTKNGLEHVQGPAQPQEVDRPEGETPTEAAERELQRRRDQKRDAPDSGNYEPSPDRAPD
jgi:hypothetical protein